MFHLGRIPSRLIQVMLPLTWDALGNTWNWHRRPKTGAPRLTWRILGALNQLHLLVGSSITWNRPTCTCWNLLECSFTCWELCPGAVEGLEPPLQGPGFGNVGVQECLLSLPGIPAHSRWALCIQVPVGQRQVRPGVPVIPRTCCSCCCPGGSAMSPGPALPDPPSLRWLLTRPR